MKGVYIFLADGFEETEALATIDVLRRGDVPVKTVSINEDALVTGAHGITVTADVIFNRLKQIMAEEGTDIKDVMIFPGGLPGASNLAQDEDLMQIMNSHYSRGGTVAAICAAPGLVVSKLPDLQGRKFTCYEGFDDAPSAKGGEYVREPAVVSGNLITGRGPGYAIDFALAILSHLEGAEKAEKVRSGMLI